MGIKLITKNKIMIMFALLYCCIAIGFGIGLTAYVLEGKQTIFNVLGTFLVITVYFPIVFGIALGVWAYKMGRTKMNFKTD